MPGGDELIITAMLLVQPPVVVFFCGNWGEAAVLPNCAHAANMLLRLLSATLQTVLPPNSKVPNCEYAFLLHFMFFINLDL